MKDEGTRVCPDCNKLMHKAGFTWSGRRKVQRWKCQTCGRTTVKPRVIRPN